MSTPPILVLAWRRPDLTERVLDAIAAQRPRRLFLACDGWNEDTPPDVIAAVRATRAVLDREPDWPCAVERRYADRNLGLRRAVAGALDWFFEAVDEGIVLEDDCLPHPDFFAYCEDLLARYRDDERVMCISGDNSSAVPLEGDASYGFIRWPLIWGWATWRRAWRHYDHDLDVLSRLSEERWREMLPDPDERRVRQERLAALRTIGRPDTWDLIWSLSVQAAGGLSTLPATNLVTNIGFGPGATHTTGPGPSRLVEARGLLPLRHPAAVERDETASRLVFDRALEGASERARFRWERTLRGRFRVALHRHITRRIPPTLRGLLPTPTAPPWMR